MTLRAAPFSVLLVLVLACLAVPLRAQIYESICRDANCTDIALGPLALIPQCYRTSLGSIGLSLNATNSSVLNICFYGADDCVDHLTTTNATVEKTCHSFVNGQASECPFLRGMNGSLYILFSWDADNIKLLQDMMELLPSYQHAKRQILNNFFGLTEFGNWCGPGHGGTRDCCDDDPCPACDYSQGLTSACLSQCPARDDLDRACAVHDFCTTNYDYHRVLPNDNFSCSSVLGTLDAEYCACDCQLVRTAMRVRSRNNLYRSALIFLFTHTTSCWYQSSSGPVCNKPGNNRILVTDFCR